MIFLGSSQCKDDQACLGGGRRRGGGEGGGMSKWGREAEILELSADLERSTITQLYHFKFAIRCSRACTTETTDIISGECRARSDSM